MKTIIVLFFVVSIGFAQYTGYGQYSGYTQSDYVDPDIVLWYRGDRYITADSYGVYGWGDVSYNHNDLEQPAQSKRPTYNANYVSFDGVDDYLYIPSPANDVSIGTSDFTIEAYIRRADYSSGANKEFINKFYDGGNRWYLSILAGGTIRIYSVSGGTQVAYAEGSYDLSVYNGDWVYICVVVDRDDDIYTYINNILRASTTNTLNSNNIDNNGLFEIGQYNGGNNFDGDIAEVRITKRVLTAAERTAYYNELQARY